VSAQLYRFRISGDRRSLGWRSTEAKKGSAY
jgi:hypothetical protein